ncbi:MAG: ABC transporter ATP-binding protein [Terrimicrobiaceae bacterium]|nr:ABC transporter ATP-binding protein [Terrimicrobiaceae bacterium]
MPRRRPASEVWPTVRRFIPSLLVYWPTLILIFVLLFSVTALDLLRPYLIGRIIDKVAQGQAWTSISMLLGVFLAVVILRSTAILARNLLTQRTGMRVTCDMRMTMFRHLQNLSLRFYDARHTGKIVARIGGDTGALYTLVTGASVNLIGDVVTIAGVLAVLLHANWQLALITYVILPLFVFNYTWHRRRLRVESRRHRRNWDFVMSFLHERISSTRLIRAFANEGAEVETFRKHIEADFHNFNRVMFRNTLLGVGADFLSGLGLLTVLACGAWFVVQPGATFTVGQLTAFLFYLGLLYTPITRIVESNSVIQQATTALEKIFALLDTRPHIPENDQLPTMPTAAGRIAFENVSFAYRPQHHTLHSINLDVAPGEMVALVGPSGSGKTTLVTLLARFYDPSDGRILIDGRDIRDFNVQSLRRQLGIVMQDNILFSGTIADNIRYGRPNGSMQEMLEAAKAANAHEFIERLPRGYETWLGERGVQLSGGQRQRIAIARVVLKDPRILILDEATSALDTESERLVQEALERLMKNRTSIVIAHRLSTVVHADKIVVVEGGRIAEAGRYRELLDKGGLFSRLHALQFAKAAAA